VRGESLNATYWLLGRTVPCAAVASAAVLVSPCCRVSATQESYSNAKFRGSGAGGNARMSFHGAACAGSPTLLTTVTHAGNLLIPKRRRKRASTMRCTAMCWYATTRRSIPNLGRLKNMIVRWRWRRNAPCGNNLATTNQRSTNPRNNACSAEVRHSAVLPCAKCLGPKRKPRNPPWSSMAISFSEKPPSVHC